jgi:hypothetical protein
VSDQRSKAPLDDHEIRIIAALANLDVRTVRRVLREDHELRAQTDRAALGAALHERGHKAEAKKVNQ